MIVYIMAQLIVPQPRSYFEKRKTLISELCHCLDILSIHSVVLLSSLHKRLAAAARFSCSAAGARWNVLTSEGKLRARVGMLRSRGISLPSLPLCRRAVRRHDISMCTRGPRTRSVMKEAALSVPAAEFSVARRRSDGGGRRGRTLRSCGILARQW